MSAKTDIESTSIERAGKHTLQLTLNGKEPAPYGLISGQLHRKTEFVSLHSLKQYCSILVLITPKNLNSKLFESSKLMNYYD